MDLSLIHKELLQQHSSRKSASDMADEEALDWRKHNRSASIGCACGPPDRITCTCLFKRIITAQIKRAREHPDRRITIQRAQSSAFYNAYQRASSGCSIHDLTAAIFLKWSTMDRFIITVDRFDRTVTPKKCINRYVLQTF